MIKTCERKRGRNLDASKILKAPYVFFSIFLTSTLLVSFDTLLIRMVPGMVLTCPGRGRSHDVVPGARSVQVIWGGQGTLMRTDEEDFMRRWTPVVRELAGPTRTAMFQQKVLMIVDDLYVLQIFEDRS